MPPEIEETLPETTNDLELDTTTDLDNQNADATDEAEEEKSLDSVLEAELESLRSGENDERSDEQKVADEVTNQDGEAGDEPVKPEEKDEETTAEAKPTDEVKPDAEATADEKEVDPDDEIMAGMKDRTIKRFTELRDENKQYKQQLEDFQTGSGELHNVILESTATSEQLAGALGIFRAINSGDIAEAQKILPEMRQFYDAIAQTAGQPAMGSDPLEQFPDLKEAVGQLDMTQANAEEMAQHRRNQLTTQRHQQNQQQEQGRTQQRGMDARQASTDIKGWEDQLLSSDPDYKLMQPAMVNKANEIMGQNPPHLWLGMLQQEYGAMHAGLVLANKNQQKNAPAPIRPDRVSGGNLAPDTSKMSLEDLMGSSLANMRG